MTLTLDDAHTTTNTIAADIARLSDAATAMLDSGLNRRALVVLLRDKTGIGLSTIERVLLALPELKSTYTTHQTDQQTEKEGAA